MIVVPEDKISFRTDALKVKYVTNIKESTFKLPLMKQVPEMR